MNEISLTLLTILSALLGGIGLFLLGMILMSDGLKAAAGGSLQRILERSTDTPLAAFLSGVGLTALVQSSNATTIHRYTKKPNPKEAIPECPSSNGSSSPRCCSP